MATQVEATFINGVFKPDGPVILKEQTRVRLTVEPIGEWTPEKGQAAWESLKEWIAKHPLHNLGPRMTRDELHERR